MSEGRIKKFLQYKLKYIKTKEVKNKLSIQLEIYVLDRYELTKRETSYE